MVYSKFFIYKPLLIGEVARKAGEFNLSVSCADSSSKALRFGNRPVLLSGQSLTGQKGPIRGP